MPYVQRDSTGQVVAIFAQPGPGHDEFLPAGHPELAALSGAGEFAHLDADLREELAADDDFLFTMVPRSVIDHETHGAKHDDAMRMFDSGHWSSPLLCREDTLRQRFWGRVNFEHMRLKF